MRKQQCNKQCDATCGCHAAIIPVYRLIIHEHGIQTLQTSKADADLQQTCTAVEEVL